MKLEQLNRMHQGKGFIAALDQSGGSTPKALRDYGIAENRYSTEEDMYHLVHAMRTRIIKSPAFTGEHILGAILFEDTIERTVDDEPTADYLWNRKGIVPFLKIDKGLSALSNGVQLMKPIEGLKDLLKRAVSKNIFGTKMRSVISQANPTGVADVVAQQFDVAEQIFQTGLVPIIEPEIDIHSPNRQETEKLLKQEVQKHLLALDKKTKVIFKFSIPIKDNFYNDLIDDAHVVRIVALSGGYSQKDANEQLARNKGLIASFSRALAQGLTAQQTDEQFNILLQHSVEAIYNASIT